MSAKSSRKKVKVKNPEVTDTLSIVIPIVLILGFLVGGILLFIHLERAGVEYDDAYYECEKLVNDGALIGLTMEECREVIGVMALMGFEEKAWLFIKGNSVSRRGEYPLRYEICVYYEEDENGNEVAVDAVYRLS